MQDKENIRINRKKTAIVAGASGLTGGFLLEQLAQDKNFERIIVLSRKAMKPALPKVKEILVDFENIGKYDFWPDADVLFCCIGTTIRKAGSQEAFKKVDYQIPLALAEQCAVYNVGFHLMSSIGADARSKNFYLRTKGETEEALRQIDLPYLYIYRPSFLLGPREERRIGESIAKVLSTLAYPFMLGPLKKYRGIHASKVAACMIKNAVNFGWGIHVLESDHISASLDMANGHNN